VKDSVDQLLQATDTGQSTYRVPVNLWRRSEYLQSICKPLTLVKVPVECLQTPDIGQSTCRVPAEYLQSTCRVPVNPWHWSEYLQSICRVPAEYLQSTCRVPVNPWHWSEYLQSICKPLTLVRVPAEYLQTSDTGWDTQEATPMRKYKYTTGVLCVLWVLYVQVLNSYLIVH